MAQVVNGQGDGAVPGLVATALDGRSAASPMVAKNSSMPSPVATLTATH
jgi:hypothetical protein